MPSARDIIEVLEQVAPLALQESYDNAGLLTGQPDTPVTGVLVALDPTQEVLDEAISSGCNLIITHHPLVFQPLKTLSGEGWVKRLLVKAVKYDLLLYAAHTNLDMIPAGVSGRMADLLGLTNRTVLVPRKEDLLKLVVYVPDAYIGKVSDALFSAGAGHIGHYDSCSFRTHGTGTFRGDLESNPRVGKRGQLHHEEEYRLETVLPRHLTGRILREMIKVHPYEEVAYDLFPLLNEYSGQGIGIIGNLPEALGEKAFLDLVKKKFGVVTIRHSDWINRPVRKVALCGGSGGEFIPQALTSGADVYLTGEIKYHQYADADGKMLFADIGHFESEQFTASLIYDLISEKFPKFAVHLSKNITNPIKYY
ncbi:MAG: Nif3-like dinuclear metal center hexameric protein [Bacteroidales bacterium]|nr:Nif3-like dinuclear metal center hexameric protein [Bacteroidales bacterium]